MQFLLELHFASLCIWHTPNSSKDPNVGPSRKTTEEGGVRAHSLAHNTLRGQRVVLELRDGTRTSWQASLTHTGLHTTHTRWLIHSWSTFGAKTSHGQHRHTRLTTARTCRKPPPSPFIVYSMTLHGGHIQMAYLSRTIRTPPTLRAHNFLCRPLIAMRFTAKL